MRVDYERAPLVSAPSILPSIRHIRLGRKGLISLDASASSTNNASRRYVPTYFYLSRQLSDNVIHVSGSYANRGLGLEWELHLQTRLSPRNNVLQFKDCKFYLNENGAYK
jgi:hypothetical protein